MSRLIYVLLRRTYVPEPATVWALSYEATPSGCGCLEILLLLVCSSKEDVLPFLSWSRVYHVWPNDLKASCLALWVIDFSIDLFGWKKISLGVTIRSLFVCFCIRQRVISDLDLECVGKCKWALTSMTRICRENSSVGREPCYHGNPNHRLVVQGTTHQIYTHSPASDYTTVFRGGLE